MRKSKKKSHKPKSEDTNQEKLYLLHIDLCGPMLVESVKGKNYNLVIVDDYSRFTLVKCLRSNYEAPDFIIKFLKMIVQLKVPVRRIQTNQTLREYYEQVGISHETSVARSAQQNGVIERRNHNETEFVNQTLREYYEKVGISYETSVVRTPQQNGVVERHNPISSGPALHEMTPATISSGPALHEMTPATISSRLVPKPTSSTPFVPPSRNDWDLLFQPLFDELLTPPPSVDPPAPAVIAPIIKVIAPESAELTGSPSLITVDQDAPSPSKTQTTPETQPPVIPHDVEEDNHDIKVAHMGNDPFYDALTQSCWIEAMQEKLNEFERLKVWELVPRPDKVMVITLKWIYKVKLDELGGLQISRSPRGIFINQSKYALESLKKYGFESCDSLDTLMKSNLDEDKEGKAIDPSHYRGMIGTLLYLTTSNLTYILLYACVLGIRLGLLVTDMIKGTKSKQN
nr:integrase, catalytic region, zinc finger, CCHC-type, peptidase aspartic, catalytic [Tanacetum cinerariifolium]